MVHNMVKNEADVVEIKLTNVATLKEKEEGKHDIHHNTKTH